jgi:Protein of unknown function (DUF3300)
MNRIKLSPGSGCCVSILRQAFNKYSSRNISALLAALRRALALSLALLLPSISCGELLAQQQAPPPQYQPPQQDYSQQIQSDVAGYPAQPYQGDNNQYPQQQPYPADNPYPQQQGTGQLVQPLGPDRLEQLVAPVALYPDSLVAMVLAAATYPTQVVEADRWVQSQGNAPVDQIAAGANAQNWDPSVKALTAFPQVLAQMDRNLPWTTDLGNAYYNQPTDTLQAVQVMRQRAQAAGNLQPTTYEAVNYVGGNIQLAPPNPQIVYVPVYNPWTAYGQPVSPYPGFSLIGALASVGSYIASGFVRFGPGIAVGAFTTMPWGLVAWGVSWLLQALLFHNSNYCSRSTTVADWGFPYGGIRASSRVYGGGGYGYRGYGGGYNSAQSAMVHRPPNGYRYPSTGYSGANGYRGQGGYNNGRAPGYGTQGYGNRPAPNAAASVHRPSSGYSGSSGYYGNRSPEASRGYEGYGNARPEQASRGYQGYGYGRPAQAYSRPSAASSYGRTTTSATLRQPNFGQRSSGYGGGGGYGGGSFGGYSAKQDHGAGGFHPFGGSHGSQGYHASSMKAPSYKAPKMKASKSYGGGGHSGGGHSGGGHSGGKHHG